MTWFRSYALLAPILSLISTFCQDHSKISPNIRPSTPNPSPTLITLRIKTDYVCSAQTLYKDWTASTVWWHATPSLPPSIFQSETGNMPLTGDQYQRYMWGECPTTPHKGCVGCPRGERVIIYGQYWKWGWFFMHSQPLLDVELMMKYGTLWLLLYQHMGIDRLHYTVQINKAKIISGICLIQ